MTRFLWTALRPWTGLLLAGCITTPLGAKEPASVAAAPAATATWRPLFNGRDLEGWTPKIVGHPAGENYANTFQARDGAIVVSYDEYQGDFDDRFGHLFYRETFSDYRLRLEYRMVGTQFRGGPAWARGNSGLMIHGQTAASMGVQQFFPVSLEVQFLSGPGADGRDRPTGNLCTPGTEVVLDNKPLTAHCANSSSKSFPLGEWVAIEVEVHGGKLFRHKVNGETVIEYTDATLDAHDADAQRLLADGASRELTAGTISLQAESHPCEYRRIEIQPLAE